MPQGSYEEVGKMLRNHEKELLPIEPEQYRLMYRVLECGRHKGERPIGVIGIPKKLYSSYAQLAKKLRVKHMAIVPKQEELLERIGGAHHSSGIVIYGMEHQLYGLVMKQQFCSITQQLLRDVTYHETEEMCFLNHILQLIHFQREEGESLPTIYSDGGEDTKKLLQKMGIECIRTYFQERLHLEVEPLEEPYGKGILTLEEMKFKPFLESKRGQGNGEGYRGISKYGIPLLLSMSLLMGISSIVQEGYYKYRTQQLDRMMGQPAYASMLAQIEKEQALEKRKGDMAQLIMEKQESSYGVIEQLNKLEEGRKVLEHLVTGYRMNGREGRISMRGYTPTAYGVIGMVKMLEKVFVNKDISYQLESNNLMAPGAFTVELTERRSNGGGDGQIHP